MESKYWDGSPILATDVLAEAKRLSREFPDHVGRSDEVGCVYTERETDPASGGYGEPIKPVCIVGTAVFNVTGKFVPSYFEGARINTDGWKQALSAYLSEEQHEAWRELMTAQLEQDRRVPWGQVFGENV